MNTIWILTSSEGQKLYFGNERSLRGFIEVAFRVKLLKVFDGIHSTAGGAPFWTERKQLIS